VLCSRTKKEFVQILLEYGVDPNRAAEGCQKTPMEIAIYNTIFSSCYKGGYFSILMLLAGFVNAETPPHTRLNILKIILERGEQDEFADEFKKNLDGLSLSEVIEERLEISWHLADDSRRGNEIDVNWVQFAAAEGKTDYLQLLLNHRLDLECHVEGSPRAIELAAVNGRLDVFSILEERLKMDPQNSEWLQLGKLLVLGMARQNDEFKERLGRVPLDKVSNEPVCGSTLLQDFAQSGREFAVAALLQYGVDPEVVTESNGSSPEILAWKSNHLEVLVEMNKFKELRSCITESDLGREVQRREERGWRKKMEELLVLSKTNDSANEDDKMWRKTMEEKQEDMVAILNQLVSLNTRNSAKAEEGVDNNANLINLLLVVSVAFVFGFLACYLLLTNLH